MKSEWLNQVAHIHAQEAWVFVVTMVLVIAGAIWLSRNE